MLSQLDELILDVPCSYCGAILKEPCKTKSGNKTEFAHSDRSWPVYQAYGLGYGEAQQDYKK